MICPLTVIKWLFLTCPPDWGLSPPAVHQRMKTETVFEMWTMYKTLFRLILIQCTVHFYYNQHNA
jgi:hypothetical protein